MVLSVGRVRAIIGSVIKYGYSSYALRMEGMGFIIFDQRLGEEFHD